MGTQQFPEDNQPGPGEKITEAGLPAVLQAVGHPHFLQRALSRRHFVRTAAGTTGIVLGAGIFVPVLALADGGDDDNHDHGNNTTPFVPNPVSGGIQPFGPGTTIYHTFPPGLNNEPSTITDFKGTFGVLLANGMGTRTDPTTGTARDAFDLDIRFMQGQFIGTDGHQHYGSFAFV